MATNKVTQPLINEAQKEADEAFFGMLRGAAKPNPGGMDFSVGAIGESTTPREEPKITPREKRKNALANGGRVRGSRDSLRKSTDSLDPDSRKVANPDGRAVVASGEYTLDDASLEADRLEYEKFEKFKKERRRVERKEEKKAWVGKTVKKSSGSVLKNSSAGNNNSGSTGGRKPAPLSIARKTGANEYAGNDGDRETRRNLDKRTARIRFSSHFKTFVNEYRETLGTLNVNYNHREVRYDDNAASCRTWNGVSVFVRKRPIFKHELQNNDYDVVSVESSKDADHDSVVLHSCTMHPNMKTMLHKPVKYLCSAAFDQFANDDDVYFNVGEDHVMKRIRSGVGRVTVLMYGQTGSGKTFTMSGIEERVARDLFKEVEEEGGDDDEDEEVADSVPTTVSIRYIELAGKKAIDLLGKKQGQEVKIIDERTYVVDEEERRSKFLEGDYDLEGEDEDEDFKYTVKVAWRGAAELNVTSAEQLMKFVAVGKGRRATESTDVNGTSSRSHAVLQIIVRKGEGQGVLTLIDCAGSERRNDSLYHSVERQKESNEINASLYALKECIRARVGVKKGKRMHIPYRSSLLTRVLRESFEDETAALSIIATTAPTATDTEHSCETLKTVSTIVGLEGHIEEGAVETVPMACQQRENKVGREEGGAAMIMPKNWSEEQLVKWLQKKQGGVFSCVVARMKAGGAGKWMMSLTAAKMAGENGILPGKLGLSTDLYNCLREEGEKIGKKIEVERKVKIQMMKGISG